MRIWSIHPSYLDTKGLIALWRETLLAKAVLEGKTNGYKNHSQLIRFKALNNPILAINYYLAEIYKEATNRGYKFDSTKFEIVESCQQIPVNNKQLEYEFEHLQKKLILRDFDKYIENINIHQLRTHPLFKIISGNIESWEKI